LIPNSLMIGYYQFGNVRNCEIIAALFWIGVGW
jgi:hypothetical protein